MVEVVPHVLNKHSQIAESAVSHSIQWEVAAKGHVDTPLLGRLCCSNTHARHQNAVTPVTMASMASLSYPWPTAETEDGEGMRNV